MTTRARLTVGGQVFDFSTVQLPDGIPNWPQLQVDELTAAGVDGTLVVNNRYAFRPFRFSGLLSHTSLNNAEVNAEALAFTRGKFGRLTMTVFGSTRTWNNVFVAEVNGIARADRGGGPYAVSAQLATIDASFVLRFSESSK